ncbi:MAG: DeoR/GlpR family DNA-binding transcription regulator [Oscillospiraceae bacterium]|nr:DeoR/GlpR family DNA-binding transcription regulator [Oscillospiraceae bacterium]
MHKVDRQKNELADMLLASESLRVQEIAQRLNVSLPTARRLCVALAGDGRATRVRGGIKRLPSNENVYSFDTLQNEHAEEKARIAKHASGFVQSNQVVFLEAGTTLRYFAMALAERIHNREISNVLIFTNSLINLDILYPVQNNIQMIGGRYRHERKDFIGYLSELTLKGLRFHYCFIGADAVSLTDGAMAMDMNTVQFDAQLVTHATKTVVLAHSEKFSKQSLISYVPIDKIDCIITDSALDEGIAAAFRQQRVNLVIV